MFKTLKDARRRVVETVLENVGASEKTVDEEYDAHVVKFESMMNDLNECAAALQNTQNKFREAFESSCQFAEILNRIYTKNVEMTDWPNVQCNMEYQYAVLNFLETMNKANFVIRQSSQTVVLEKTLQPMHESVTKMGPDIDEICKDRNLKMKDYDSYKRRLKGFEQKKEALENQGKSGTPAHNEIVADIAKFENKQQAAFQLYTEQNIKAKEEMINAKRAHDQLMDNMTSTVIAAYSELFRQTSVKFDDCLGYLPKPKVDQVTKRVHDFMLQGEVRPVEVDPTTFQKGLAIFTGKALPSDFKKNEDEEKNKAFQKALELENAKKVAEDAERERNAGSKLNSNPFEDTLSPSAPPLATTPATVVSPSAAAKKTQPLKKARALFDHEPDEADELPFVEGDMIDVYEIGDDGWSRGLCNGKEGLFPTNYVEMLQ